MLEPRKSKLTLALCGGAHFVHDGFSDALYVLLPLWSQAFGLSIAQAGLLRAVFVGAQAGFQIPAGFLSERRGERVLLAGGTLLTALAFIFLGAAVGFFGLAAVLVFAGLGSAVQHPLSSALVARAYGTGTARSALGIYNFCGDLGKVAVPAGLALAIGVVGWRSGTFGYGVIGIAAAIVLYIVLRRLDIGGPVSAAQAQTVDEGEKSGWGIRHRRGFASLAGIGAVDSSVRFSFLTLLPFVLAERGAGVETVGLALALVFAGGAAGRLVCGFVAERFGVIRTTVLTELVTGAGIIVIATLPVNLILIALPVLGLALAGTSSVLYGTVAEFVRPERQGRAFGLFYSLTAGISIPAPAMFGLIGDMAGVSIAVVAIGGFALLTLPLCLILASSRAALGAKG